MIPSSKETEWLKFVEMPHRLKADAKTRYFAVLSKCGMDTEIGVVKWYSRWRHYCYFPSELWGTILSNRCLRDLAEFIEELENERKQLKEVL